jgi:hypothetical protein
LPSSCQHLRGYSRADPRCCTSGHGVALFAFQDTCDTVEKERRPGDLVVEDEILSVVKRIPFGTTAELPAETRYLTPVSVTAGRSPSRLNWLAYFE